MPPPPLPSSCRQSLPASSVQTTPRKRRAIAYADEDDSDGDEYEPAHDDDSDSDDDDAADDDEDAETTGGQLAAIGDDFHHPIPIIIRASSSTPSARPRARSSTATPRKPETPRHRSVASPAPSAPKTTPRKRHRVQQQHADDEDSNSDDLWGMDDDVGDVARHWREASAVMPLHANWRASRADSGHDRGSVF
jgi:hypothetical protein